MLDKTLLSTSDCLLLALKDVSASELVDTGPISSCPVSWPKSSVCVSSPTTEAFEFELHGLVGLSFVAQLGADGRGRFTLAVPPAAERLLTLSEAEGLGTGKCDAHCDGGDAGPFRCLPPSEVDGLDKSIFGVHFEAEALTLGPLTISGIEGGLDKDKSDALFDGENLGQLTCFPLSAAEGSDKSKSDVPFDAEGSSQFRPLTLSEADGLDKRESDDAHSDGESLGQFRCFPLSGVEGLNKSRFDVFFDVELEGFSRSEPDAFTEDEGFDTPELDARFADQGSG